MVRLAISRILAILLLIPALWADVRHCACDISKPETLDARECSLCKEVEKSPTDEAVIFLKDINPRKANRLLVLPRKHYLAGHALDQMPAADRTVFWTAAIKKAKELWGEDWGAAMNGEQARTQCHGHIHVGKLVDDMEYAGGVYVDTPAQIPVPAPGTGIWVHQSGTRLHVHMGEQITETVLMR